MPVPRETTADEGAPRYEDERLSRADIHTVVEGAPLEDSAARKPGPLESAADAAPESPVGSSVSRETPARAVPRETDANGPSVAPVAPAWSHDDDRERSALAAELPATDDETPLAHQVAVDARRRITLSGKVFPKPDTTRILTVANQKGGVGKTTTTVNVAAALAQAGLRVLVIDIDPQGNASTALGIDHHAEVSSIYDVLVDGMDVAEVVQECPDIPNLWCAPATIDLAGAEIELVSLVARETRMQRALRRYIDGAAARGEERLDYVLIDCPPSLGLLTVNAFVAAEEVFIPIQCEYYALEGLSQLLKNIELIKNHLNPDLHVSTILLTMYDGRTRLSAQVADDVRSHFPEQVLRTTVPRSVRISEAPSHGQTVMTYDPSSSGALSYLEAAGELADRGAASH
jgi:chromosome partitioning protein